MVVSSAKIDGSFVVCSAVIVMRILISTYFGFDPVLLTDIATEMSTLIPKDKEIFTVLDIGEC